MLVPHGTTIAVADGEQLHLYRNSGSETEVKLATMDAPAVGGDNKSAGVRHPSSSANPQDSRLEEDSFAAATAQWLNQQVLGNKIADLVIVAAPKTLGEMRRHYHKGLEAKLLAEIGKDLTGHAAADIEAALKNA